MFSLAFSHCWPKTKYIFGIFCKFKRFSKYLIWCEILECIAWTTLGLNRVNGFDASMAHFMWLCAHYSVTDSATDYWNLFSFLFLLSKTWTAKIWRRLAVCFAFKAVVKRICFSFVSQRMAQITGLLAVFVPNWNKFCLNVFSDANERYLSYKLL